MTCTPGTVITSAAELRANYPEFSDKDRYPDSGIDWYLMLAQGPLPNDAQPLIRQERSRGMYKFAVLLYVAHNIVLERRAQDEADNGAPPGISTGPVSAKSIDKVSISYDTAIAAYKDAGQWNLTIYGTRFYQLMMMFGMGPVYVGAGAAPYPTAPGSGFFP